METSAKTGVGVETLFEQIAREFRAEQITLAQNTPSAGMSGGGQTAMQTDGAYRQHSNANSPLRLTTNEHTAATTRSACPC